MVKQTDKERYWAWYNRSAVYCPICGEQMGLVYEGDIPQNHYLCDCGTIFEPLNVEGLGEQMAKERAEQRQKKECDCEVFLRAGLSDNERYTAWCLKTSLYCPECGKKMEVVYIRGIPQNTFRCSCGKTLDPLNLEGLRELVEEQKRQEKRRKGIEECKGIFLAEQERLENLSREEYPQFLKEVILESKRVQYLTDTRWVTQKFLFTTATGGPSVVLDSAGHISVDWWEHSYHGEMSEKADKAIDAFVDWFMATQRS